MTSPTCAVPVVTAAVEQPPGDSSRVGGSKRRSKRQRGKRATQKKGNLKAEHDGMDTCDGVVVAAAMTETPGDVAAPVGTLVGTKRPADSALGTGEASEPLGREQLILHLAR